MNRSCVHIDIDLNVSTDEWLRDCQGVVDRMLSVPGLEWKLWVASPATSSAGGIYLFRDEASASAYVSGPVIAALRRKPSVRDVRIRVYVVDDDLSRRTHAIGDSHDRAS
jgi:Putative mono-oxygenase ydhR